jgi:pSer/pThr/pTyr-binding forkhead associated (FHA) protein
MRFRLRYLQHDLELNEGPFLVGRSADCQLSLDDALVSRRHALFVIGEEGVTVEDLQSRNGLVVNGRRVIGKTWLQPGDRIVIGSQELTLLRGMDGSERDTADVAPPKWTTLPRTPAAASRETERPGATARHFRGEGEEEGESSGDSSMVRKLAAFRLLGGVAEKALAMGRVDEAERLLAGPLSEIVDASRSGKAIAPSFVDMAARIAAKIATATTKGAWADYVVELYTAQARPCPAAVVDELNAAFRKVNSIDLARLRSYLGVLRERQATFGPTERFLLQRIEGLERLAALR